MKSNEQRAVVQRSLRRATTASASRLRRTNAEAAAVDQRQRPVQRELADAARDSPTLAAQRQLADAVRDSPRIAAQRKFTETVLDSPYVVAQRQQLRSMFGDAAQLKDESRSRQWHRETGEAQPSKIPGTGQLSFGSTTMPLQQESAKNGNPSGLPGQLKSGIEAVSGVSMDGVRVHYNSNRPAQLNALAYAQGSDIHVGPGQERHLPHEAWHVVQQAQGRVRPTMQMAGGVPVNDNAGLEKEADRMGAKVSRMAAPTGAGERSGALAQLEKGAWLSSASAATSQGSVAQRTIHRYRDVGDGFHWYIEEIGTKGLYEIPKNGDAGEYFNDVTGKSGATIEEVRAGLLDAMMITGSLGSFKTRDLTLPWGELAKKLSSKAAELGLEATKDSLLYLGEVLVRFQGDEHHIKDASKAEIDPLLFETARNFALDLMEANGQLAYIERQAWYASGEYEIHIDLNFYYNRPLGTGGLGMHKDTGGDNLFVNLVFDNEKETPATEWTEDREPIQGAKAELMGKLVPPQIIAAIEEAKGRLGKEAHAYGEQTIQGGTMPPMAFVSWVDEMIWHSTPSLENRPHYESAATAKLIEEQWSQPDSDWRREALFTLLEKNDGLVATKAKLLREQHKTFTVAAWNELEKEFTTEEHEQLKKEIREFDWVSVKWSGRSGNELDVDERTGSEPSHIPTGVTGRRRVNSDARTLERVKQAAETQPKRSFLRTWVRVVKKGKK